MQSKTSRRVECGCREGAMAAWLAIFAYLACLAWGKAPDFPLWLEPSASRWAHGLAWVFSAALFGKLTGMAWHSKPGGRFRRVAG